eukprot:60552-Chlamydomonas_euryale.AAC.1
MPLSVWSSQAPSPDAIICLVQSSTVTGCRYLFGPTLVSRVRGAVSGLDLAMPLHVLLPVTRYTLNWRSFGRAWVQGRGSLQGTGRQAPSS